MMPGFGSLDEAQLSEALDQICRAAGVTRDKLVSVDIIGGDSVRYVRSGWRWAALVHEVCEALCKPCMRHLRTGGLQRVLGARKALESWAIARGAGCGRSQLRTALRRLSRLFR